MPLSNFTGADFNSLFTFNNRSVAQKFTTIELHEFLKLSGLSERTFWIFARHLLDRHQFTVEDFRALKNVKFIDYDFIEESHYDDYYEDGEDIIGECSDDLNDYKPTDQRIIGSDLTENDIVQIIMCLTMNLGRINLWAAYVISDRLGRDNTFFTSSFDRMSEYESADIKKMAYLANVNSNFAALVYGKIQSYNKQNILKIYDLLNPMAKDVFDRKISLRLEDLPPHQQRYHPSLPSLKELSLAKSNPRDVDREKEFIPDLDQI